MFGAVRVPYQVAASNFQLAMRLELLLLSQSPFSMRHLSYVFLIKKRTVSNRFNLEYCWE